MRVAPPPARFKVLLLDGKVSAQEPSLDAVALAAAAAGAAGVKSVALIGAQSVVY